MEPTAPEPGRLDRHLAFLLTADRLKQVARTTLFLTGQILESVANEF